jgi:hypothetical protein
MGNKTYLTIFSSGRGRSPGGVSMVLCWWVVPTEVSEAHEIGGKTK